MVRVPPKTESRRPNPESLARPGGRGRGPKTENRKPFWPFSHKKWSGYLRRPKAEGRIPKAWPGPAGGAQARQKNGPGTSEDRKPKAESGKLGPARREGQGPEDRKPKTVFAVFAQKMVRVPLKTDSRRPNPESLARPGGRGRGPKTENRFCHFHQKNGPGTSEDRKPKAESRKLGPARQEGQGPKDRKPKTVFAIFAQKNGPGTSEDRKPKAESGKLGPARREGQGPEDRKPKTVFAVFAKKWSGYL